MILLLILIDLFILGKLLETKEDKPTSTANKVVYIKERPRRVKYFPQEEPEVDLEAIKEELRLKFIERRKAWDEATLWNKEANLEIFRKKKCIIP